MNSSAILTSGKRTFRSTMTSFAIKRVNSYQNRLRYLEHQHAKRGNLKNVDLTDLSTQEASVKWKLIANNISKTPPLTFLTKFSTAEQFLDKFQDER